MRHMILVQNSILNFKDLLWPASGEGRLEAQVSKDFNRSPVFTANGRNALYLALKEMGLKKDDEIIVPAYTCKIVPETVRQFCTPVFADIDKDTYLIRPEEIESRITSRTKGVIPIHLYGNPCDMGRVMEIAKENSLTVIEDVAQAFLGRYEENLLGTFGEYSIFSFRFSKDITAFNGGMLLLDSPINVPKTWENSQKTRLKLLTFLFGLRFFERLPASMYSQIERILSRHFQAENWQFRPDKKGLSSFQKNLLLKQYLLFEEVINKRRQNASFYNEKLKSIVRTPKETEKGAHTYLRYTISTERRDELYDYLISKGIQAEKMYDYSFGTREEYPSSHVASRNNLNIPVHSNLTKKDLEKVVRVIHEFFEME